MKNLGLAIIFFSGLLFSCQKERIPNDCAALEGTKIISEKVKEKTCHYREVFDYEGELWMVGECCVCGLVYMAANCNGETLCDLDEDCMIDFAKDAVYLYTVVEN